MEESILNAICTVYIPVSNVDQSVEWYRDKLGFQWIGYCFQLASGPSIFLVQSKDRPNMNYRTDDWDGQDFEMYALTFKVADIYAAHRQLKANGVKVDEVIFTNPGSGYNFKFYDLDGNKFDVWAGFPEGWHFEAAKPKTSEDEAV